MDWSDSTSKQNSEEVTYALLDQVLSRFNALVEVVTKAQNFVEDFRSCVRRFWLTIGLFFMIILKLMAWLKIWYGRWNFLQKYGVQKGHVHVIGTYNYPNWPWDIDSTSKHPLHAFPPCFKKKKAWTPIIGIHSHGCGPCGQFGWSQCVGLGLWAMYNLDEKSHTYGIGEFGHHTTPRYISICHRPWKWYQLKVWRFELEDYVYLQYTTPTTLDVIVVRVIFLVNKVLPYGVLFLEGWDG